MQSSLVPTEVIQPFLSFFRPIWNCGARSGFARADIRGDWQHEGLMEQSRASTGTLARSQTFTTLMMLKNYSDFISELSQNTYAMMSQGQATFMQQAQEAAANVIDATDARTHHRQRRAA